jgi:hypothetical protein
MYKTHRISLLSFTQQGETMGCLLELFGLVGMVAVFFLVKVLSPLGVLVVLVLLVLLYFWAKKHGNDITPGMELTAPNTVELLGLGLIAGVCYFYWKEPILGFFQLLFR